ncbi:zinc-ribbon domain-containing protein [Patescibacteria group bacterium]|nr:zinc-ribbon domain-containing protein [Patescibacteria group bacterium]MBU1931841.1 zinc-ribbon domain-containing protein [Patescibacteria group bacterium]
MKDKIIKCQDCAQEFAWTIGEQEFYQQKDLKPPVRCPICRATHKAAADDNFRGKVLQS